jgi:glycosyltransferase involved in cell wall biosynthesis
MTGSHELAAPKAIASGPPRTLDWPGPVLMISPTASRTGGIDAHIFDLADAMKEAQLDVAVTVVPLRAGGVLAPEPGRIDAGRGPEPAEEAMSQTERLIADLAPQVIHVHNSLDREFLERLRRRAPVVQSVHNHSSCTHGLRYFKPGHECHRPHAPACLANSLLRNCGHRRVPRVFIDKYRQTSEHLDGLRQTDGVVAYSNYVADDLRINGIPRVSPLRLFVHDRPAPSTSQPDARRVLFAGRVVPEKGLDVLLGALVKVDAVLEVQGDGWGLERCRRLSSKLGLDGRVQFRGWASKSELDEAYGRCAVVAVPSVWPEPFGLVGLEAMIHSRPVVASDTGGISDWLAQDVNGCLVRPGDPDALAAALERVLDNPDEAAEMGRRGREIALTEFSVEQHLTGLRSVYQQAIARWTAGH